MKKKYKSTKGKKKQSFKLFPILLLILASALTIFFAQQTNQKQIIKSNAQVAQCSTPGGCGGNCDPSQNSGCGYGGCRFWEYCADLDQNDVYSCYDTTSLGTKEPDYSIACGQEKANMTSSGSTNPTATRIPTRTPDSPPSSAPQTPQPTAPPPNTPQQNSICNKPEGCGGSCNPLMNMGCGYGGCRLWEYCADENNDSIYSCYDTTNLGKTEPDLSKACGPERTSSTNKVPTNAPQVTSTPIPTTPSGTPPPTATVPTEAIPTGSIVPTATPQADEPTNTDTPIPSQTEPTIQPTTPPSTGAGTYDMSKLCIPVEINGSQNEKLDIGIIPVGFTQSQLENGFYPMAETAIKTLKSTNLQKYPNETYNKINWHIINTVHSDFKQSYQFPPDATENDKINIVFDFGDRADYCGRDLYMIIPYMPDANGGLAIYGSGAIIYSGGISYDGGLAFAHEWGHTAGGMSDEVPSTNNDDGPNCTRTSASADLPSDPCPPNGSSDVAGNYFCTQGTDYSAFQKACPAWDCSQKSCSNLEKQLLAGSGCYPRCGTTFSYRPAPNSIMGNPWDPILGLEFNGPSLVYLIEVALSRYK